MQLFLGLADANRGDEIFAAVLRLADANRDDEILAALQRSEAMIQSIDHKQSDVKGHSASRTELFSVLGRSCAFVHRPSGCVPLHQFRMLLNDDF